MKIKLFILIVVFGSISLFTYESYGQQSSEMSASEHRRMDSLQQVEKRVQHQQRVKDENTLKEAKNASNKTDVNAKEAKRVEQDASDASKQTKKALKAEKKAQKARIDADKQAQKALNARGKSDNN